MITLHNIRGHQFVLNSELIETIEEAGDTTIHLIDGKPFIVQESAADIVELVRQWKLRCQQPSVVSSDGD